MHDSTVVNLQLMAEPTCFLGMKRRHTQAISNSKWNITILCSASVSALMVHYVLYSASVSALMVHYVLCSASVSALMVHYVLCSVSVSVLTVHYVLCSASVSALTVHYVLCSASVSALMVHYVLCSASVSALMVHYVLCSASVSALMGHYVLCSASVMPWRCTTMQDEIHIQQNTILLQTLHCCLHHKLSIWMCQWINKTWTFLLHTWSSAEAILSPSMTS